MTPLERLQTPLVLAAAIGGLGLHAITGLGHRAEPLVLPALAALLVTVFLQVSAARLREVPRQLRVVGASLAVNFVWTPVLAWLLGALVLGAAPDLRLGLLLLLVTPCTDWYLVFTGLARGNVALATALLPVNLGLQLALLPVYVLVFAGALVTVDLGAVLVAVVGVLLGPGLVAAALRRLAIRVRGTAWLEQVVLARLGSVTLGLLVVAVAALFAAHGEVLAERPGRVLLVIPALAVFFVVNLVLSRALGRVLGLAHREGATLVMTTLARNSPLALAIAVAAFPDRPLVALALVAGPLIELPVLSAVAQALRRRAPATSAP